MYKRYANNFMKYEPTLVGIYQMPKIKKIEQIPFLQATPFNYALTTKNFDLGVHFFLDDYQFERFWNNPDLYINLLSKFQYVMAPDFSLYTNMPKAMQIWNRYRSQWLGSYMQSNGIIVVPTISWSDNESLDWVFDGIEKNGIVAVSSVGCLKNSIDKEAFIHGYQAMIKKIDPSVILFYGTVPKELENIKIFKLEAYQNKFREKEVI